MATLDLPPRSAPAVHAPTADALALVRTSSLPDLVRQELERMILAGELPSGAKLTEAALAARLGVSRGPVREAFRALGEMGLVRVEKNRGVFVRRISVEEADQIYEVRAILDEWIGRRLAQKATSEQIRGLRAHVERLERAAARHDVDGYYHLNLEFHDRLVAACGNPKLVATYRRLVNELSLFRHQTLAQGETMSASTREHREIVERIASGNPAAAGKALLDHVLAGRERMRRAHPDAAPAPRRGVGLPRRSR
ncbi:MAG TPA: phosphonate utilization associated transcriptional regulator [Casimicrobiaceae bacterium]|nr:phosphonate utilization associated transcriptional regulator [Casimicrobiaceae bacterium]